MTTPALVERVAAKRERLRELKRKAARRWHDDPTRWVTDCVEFDDGEGLADYQADELDALQEHKRVAVRGPRGSGKTMPAALTFWWFACTRELAGEDWKIPTTAGSWPQITVYLWPEIHKWSRRIRWDVMGLEPPVLGRHLLAHHLKWNFGEGFGRAVTDPDLIEGAHADEMLVIIDEGKSVADPVWDAIEGFFANPGNHYVYALSTPGAKVGRFSDIHHRRPGYEDWYPIHVTIDQAVAAGRISEEWVEQRRLQWGEESRMFQCHVLANFAGEEDGVIPMAWVEAAVERGRGLDVTGMRPEVVAVDVADTGDDSTVIARRDGWTVYALDRFTDGTVLDHADKVKNRCDDNSVVFVDSIGVGAGTLASLQRDGVDARGFVASARSTRLDATGQFGFSNLRAEAWWHMRELLDPEHGEQIVLPDDPELLGDLTAPRYKEVAGGKVLIESKDDIRKRLGRSTDVGDAVVMLYAVVEPDWAFA